MERIEWKNLRAMSSYNKSYASLCSERRKIIDQLYEVTKLEEESKKNPKRSCR